MRTQSLGNVKSWNSSLESKESKHLPDINRGKPKEKEWIETSLDFDVPQIKVKNVPPIRPATQTNYLPRNSAEKMLYRKEIEKTSSILFPNSPREQEVLMEKERKIPQTRFVDNRNLEIPAESKQKHHTNEMIPLNSPTNHTVIQPGKFQPYREETKPFEMSDFYKYSTKFRKKPEIQEPRNEHLHQPSSSFNEVDHLNNQPHHLNPTQQIRQQKSIQRKDYPPSFTH